MVAVNEPTLHKGGELSKSVLNYTYVRRDSACQLAPMGVV